MSAFYFPGENFVEISAKDLAKIKDAAAKSPLRRARYCFHQDNADRVHEMVIAFCKDTYIRPHRHINKSESFHIIEGKVEVLFFDDAGVVIRRIVMGEVSMGFPFFYRLANQQWHMMLPLTDYVVVHEATAGPFIKEDSSFPDWAPGDEDKHAIKQFIETLKDR